MQSDYEQIIISRAPDIDNYFYIKRVYNKERELSMVQVLNKYRRIYKCLFYDENKRLSNASIYNTTSGKEIKHVTYKSDGKTISSVREYDSETGIPIKVIFYKPDGKCVSSIIEYDESGIEAKFMLYCDDGKVISAAI